MPLDIPYVDATTSVGVYPDGKDKLDVYEPASTPTHGPGLPVLVFVHGGALLIGDKSHYTRLGEWIAEQGHVCVVLNHRLSPGVSHPAHIEDVAAGFAWVVRNIDRYGGDPKRTCLFGHSSGAYLAGLLAFDERYLAKHGLSTKSIRGVVPISGFFHVERLAPERPKSVWGEDLAAWKAASPARYVSASAPPTLLLYAANDAPERRQESEDVAALLKASGHAQVATAEIADRDHTSIIVRFGSNGDETSQKVLAFADGLA